MSRIYICKKWLAGQHYLNDRHEVFLYLWRNVFETQNQPNQVKMMMMLLHHASLQEIRGTSAHMRNIPINKSLTAGSLLHQYNVTERNHWVLNQGVTFYCAFMCQLFCFVFNCQYLEFNSEFFQLSSTCWSGLFFISSWSRGTCVKDAVLVNDWLV